MNHQKNKNGVIQFVLNMYLQTYFDPYNNDLNVVCNVHGINPKRYYGECIYCGREKGAKIFCNIKGHHTIFHAACGLVNGCIVEDIAGPDAEHLNRAVYCPAHVPEVIERSGNHLLKKMLKQSQKRFGNC